MPTPYLNIVPRISADPTVAGASNKIAGPRAVRRLFLQDTPLQERLVVNVEGAREIGPAEAEGLVRECLVLTHKRLDAALWLALERLQGSLPDDDELETAPESSPLDRELVFAVRSQRAKFIPRFKEAFDQAFERRRDGKARKRGQSSDSFVALALIDHGDHGAQVAVKSAVLAMREAALEEAFALDFRVRLVLREAPTGAAFANPWSSDYICDAVGKACRGLWPAERVWRPIMERLVRATTPQVVALHRELNVLLQDRDVLPTLRVRTHGRGAREAQALGGHVLYNKLVEMLGASTKAAQFPPLAAAGMPPGARDAVLAAARTASQGVAGVPTLGGARVGEGRSWGMDTQLWSALVGVLTALQRGQVAAGLPGISQLDRDALRAGNSNELPALKAAIASNGGSAIDAVIIDIVAGVLDYVFDDPYIPAEIKAVFGRLQIPILKAALLDRRVLTDSQHLTRRFFDTLAAASIGLQPESAQGQALIELANRLAARIRDDFGDDLVVFETAKCELDAFLDHERARSNQQLAEAVPSLIAQDERAAARDEAAAALEARLAGRIIPPAVRAFLDHECVERLTAVCLEQGSGSSAWERQLGLVDDLIWSIAPKTQRIGRKRLAKMVPQLLRRIDEDCSTDEVAQARRQALRSCLFELHLAAMKAGGGATSQGAPTGVPAASMPHPSRTDPKTSQPRDPDEYDEQVVALVRGDWCTFTGDRGERTLARLGWRAPQRKRLLFTHRDGSTAFVQTPQSLAEAFRTGRAAVAIEAIPLFERAMGQLVEREARTSGAATATTD